MAHSDPKDDLLRYLRRGRDALVGKLDGLGSYDARRPMTPTATNLLGIVKHVAFVQAGYLGATFDRPFPEPPPWEAEGGELDDDMWARADESVDDIVALFHRTSTHADATVEALPLDATGRVPWWPEDRREVTLHFALVHLIAEVDRHAGQADILRELIDGTVGLAGPGGNMPERDAAEWEAFRARVEAAARQAVR
ncbi:MAG TPA: DinB family protein [Acidimicrobiales bacterium]|nr:DinB family protein [Acidimicrobiales bacterium]